jgi:hypothetical protein
MQSPNKGAVHILAPAGSFRKGSLNQALIRMARELTPYQVVFPEVSRVCKIPANKHIISKIVFSTFQDISLGCCTVAAHRARSGLEPTPFW